jgi:hypothetical protein
VIGTDWCAPNQKVPRWSAAGVATTVAAWLGTPSGSGTSFSAAQSAVFNAGGPSPRDCCSGCVSGSGIQYSLRAPELASTPDLDVTVADGANAGTYKATAVAALSWRVTVGGVAYTLCAAGAGLVIKGPAASAWATAVAAEPFSANFPGALFGAADEAVVTLA